MDLDPCSPPQTLPSSTLRYPQHRAQLTLQKWPTWDYYDAKYQQQLGQLGWGVTILLILG